MMMILQDLQDLQIHISNSLQKIALNINICVFENGIRIDCYTCLFQNISGTSKGVGFCSSNSYEENRAQLNYFVKYVKKISQIWIQKR